MFVRKHHNGQGEKGKNILRIQCKTRTEMKLKRILLEELNRFAVVLVFLAISALLNYYSLTSSSL